MFRMRVELITLTGTAFEAAAYTSSANETLSGSGENRTLIPIDIRTLIWRVSQLHHWTIYNYLRKDSNLHTIWQLILSQPCLPLHHAGMYYSEPDLHRQAISATGLKPVVYSKFHHQSINAEGWIRTIDMQIFSLSLLPAELLPHKKFSQ